MQVFQTTSNPNNFKFNGLTYPKNFMCIKQGDESIAIHNAYDTRFQLLGSTHYSQFQVNGVTPSSQANLMAALSTLIFAKQFNYITQVNGGNQLISIGTITVDTNYVTIEPAEWTINGLNYETTSNTVLTVPFAATDKNRIDIIVANDTNELIRITGTETSGIAVAPIVPLNSIYVTQISVNDNIIGEPDAPISGEYYITKAQEGVRYHSHAGAVDNIILGKETHNLLTGSITEIRGYNFAIENLELYVGKRYLLVNNLGSDIIIRNDDPNGIFRFYLNNSQDLILKSTQTVEFWFTNFGEFRQIDTLPSLQNVTDNGNVTNNPISWSNTTSGVTSLEVNPSTTGDKVIYLPSSGGTLALLSDIPATSGGTGSSELEKITEGGNTGWALLGRTPANYGNIGSFAVDLSTTTFANSTYGATGTYSFATGHNNKASGEGSVAICNGTNANNYGAFAAGTITTANGYVSSVFGEYNTANSYAETVLGHYATNLTGTTNSIISNEPVFRIGVGADNSNRADGFRVYNNGSSYFKPFATSGITGSQGYFGYNSTTNLMAFHNGTTWSDLSTKTYADTKIAKHTGTTYTTNAIVTLTQAEYNAISGSTDANTLYFII